MSTADPQFDNKTFSQPKEHAWTVLIYMAGDNNLSEECVYALTEIKLALTDNKQDKLAVAAQFDPNGVRAETRRFLLRSNDTTLNQDVVWRARETDTGEPHNLLDFIRWGITEYDADHYMVVLVGHGSGTDDDFLLRDENPANALGILELHDVFRQLTNDGHKIDILGFDTCLMNMAEVCFELNRTSITYLVGSEGFAPNTGWPYKEILQRLISQIKDNRGGATPEWLTQQVIPIEYIKFYKPYIAGGISVDQSVLSVEKIDEVKEEVFRLSNSLLAEIKAGELNYSEPNKTPKPKNEALILAHWEAQSYNGEAFVDLSDFCERLAQRYPDPKSDVVTYCNAVMNRIKEMATSYAAGSAFQFSRGLSIYFPWSVLSPKYGNLSFPKESKWLDFLQQYHEITRRPGRVDGGETRTLQKGKPVPAGPTVPNSVRSSVPNNKGRDGNVESMRNPPANEFVSLLPATNGHVPETITPVSTAKPKYRNHRKSQASGS